MENIQPEDVRSSLQAALKQAMLNKDAERRDLIRMALNVLNQEEVDQRRALSPEDVVTLLQKEVSKRRDSIDEARKAGRDDIAEAEVTKLAILEGFMPAQMSREEIAAVVRTAIQDSGATSVKDMGKVMAVLMPQVRGRADGKLVNEVVRELLAQ